MQVEPQGPFSKLALDITSLTPAVTSPAWVPVLEEINLILTLVSLLLGIGLALWRGYVWLKRGPQ